MTPKLSVLVPAYNEIPTIEVLVGKVLSLDIDLEIIIVDDGSTDGTREIVERLAINPRMRLFMHHRNRGKGAAIRTGIKHASGEYTIIQDADLEYDPADYETILRKFEDPDVSVVYGSRRTMKGNSMSSLSFFLGGVTLTMITNLLFRTGITDEPTCYKAFRTDLLKSLPLECEGFEFCPEVTAKVAKRGIRIAEVPIHYYPRSNTEGKKIRARHWFDAVGTLLAERFRRD